jgi:hypothetical protein
MGVSIMLNSTASQWNDTDFAALLVARQSPAIDVTSWESLVRIEPRLAELERATGFVRQDDPWLWRKYGDMKRKLSSLAGWTAARPELRTSQVFGVAHRRLLNKLEGRPNHD